MNSLFSLFSAGSHISLQPFNTTAPVCPDPPGWVIRFRFIPTKAPWQLDYILAGGTHGTKPRCYYRPVSNIHIFLDCTSDAATEEPSNRQDFSGKIHWLMQWQKNKTCMLCRCVFPSVSHCSGHKTPCLVVCILNNMQDTGIFVISHPELSNNHLL